MKLIATRGLPGCGKSTWAEQQVLANPANTVRVNRDLFRIMLHFNKWNKEAEKLTVAARNATLRILMNNCVETIICDDTNLDPEVMASLQYIASINGYAFEITDFTDVPLHVCIDRDANREGRARVGSEVILRMYNKYLIDTVK